MGSSAKHFAVIACEDAEKWGFEDKIGDFYINAFQENGDTWTKFGAVSGQIPREEDISKYNAFVFSGSRFCANDDEEWIRKLKEFIRLVSQTTPRPKLLGICFGHQLLASALGGVIERNPSGEFILQSEVVKFSEELKQKPAFSKLCDNGQARLLEVHGDCVTKLPEGARSLARSCSCEHEIVEFKENILGVQSHPELSPEDIEDKILKIWRNDKRITQQESDEIWESCKLPLDSAQMNEALKKYLHE